MVIKGFVGYLVLAALLVLLAVVLVGCENKGRNPGQNSTANQTNQTDYPPVHGIEVTYCEGLGYKYDYRLNTSTGRKEEYCRLNKDIECPAWDFVSGECHRELTLCSLKGYILKIGVEQYETYNATYPICIFPDSSYCKEVDFFNKNCHVKW
jgi:putative hemolysin